MRRFRLPTILDCRNSDALLQTIETSADGALKGVETIYYSRSSEIITALMFLSWMVEILRFQAK
jgi:hypothetical protein